MEERKGIGIQWLPVKALQFGVRCFGRDSVLERRCSFLAVSMDRVYGIVNGAQQTSFESFFFFFMTVESGEEFTDGVFHAGQVTIRGVRGHN